VKNSAKILANVFARGCHVEGVGKNRNFHPTSRFISETIQDIAIFTVEDE